MKVDKFKVGDKVWYLNKGWGNVVNDRYIKSHPIIVEFKNGDMMAFTGDGKCNNTDKNGALFFEEITIPKSAYIRPKWRAEKDREHYYYVSSYGSVGKDTDYRRNADNKRFEVGNYFKTEEEAKESKFYKVFLSGCEQ